MSVVAPSGSYSVSIVIGGRFHAFDLARELQARHLLEQLITSYPKRKTREFKVPDERVTSFPLVYLQRALEKLSPRVASASLSHLNESFGRLAPLALQRRPPSIVHAWSGYAHRSLRWAKQHGVPTVLERSSSHILTQFEILATEHERLGVRWKQTAARWIDRDLAEYELADLIAVPSLFAKQSFVERGFAESRLLHAPFGTDLSSFSPGAKSDNAFRVVYAGQLAIRKGIHDLIRAFQLAQVVNSELCLVGGATAETPVVLREAREGVRLVGHVPQAALVREYRAGTVFVMQSVEEGLAYVQAQAMATGLPLICTTNTGGEDLLRMSGDRIAVHGGEIHEYPAGYMVPIRRPDLTAQCLRWLATDRDLLQSKRDAAISIAGRELGWGRYTETVVAGYDRLIGRGEVFHPANAEA
ncbi:MAG: hypothetical protein RLZZ450_6993 [Pseudomonadota bacterium]|jgi:glycosyltransferase involved in cell wall biosynthesis